MRFFYLAIMTLAFGELMRWIYSRWEWATGGSMGIRTARTIVIGFVVGIGGAMYAALIGPNGAGNSTLFNAVTGNAPVSSGSIRCRGPEIRTLRPDEPTRCGIRRSFQNGALFPDLSVLENILAGMHTTIPSRFCGRVFATPASAAYERAASRRARELLELMGIGHLADRPELKGQAPGEEIVRAIYL